MNVLSTILYVALLAFAMTACTLVTLPGMIAPSVAMIFGGAP